MREEYIAQVEFTVEGSVEDFGDQAQADLRLSIALMADVKLRFVELVIAEASVAVTAKIRAATDGSASSMVAAMSEQLSSPRAASQLLGVQVTSTPIVEKGVQMVVVPAPMVPPPQQPVPAFPAPAQPPLVPITGDTSSTLTVVAVAASSSGALILLVLSFAFLYACHLQRRMHQREPKRRPTQPVTLPAGRRSPHAIRSPSSRHSASGSPAMRSIGHSGFDSVLSEWADSCEQYDDHEGTMITDFPPLRFANADGFAPRPVIPSMFAGHDDQARVQAAVMLQRQTGLRSERLSPVQPPRSRPSQQRIHNHFEGSPGSTSSTPTGRCKSLSHYSSPGERGRGMANDEDDDDYIVAQEEQAAIAGAVRHRVDAALKRDSGDHNLPSRWFRERESSRCTDSRDESIAQVPLGAARPILRDVGSASEVMASRSGGLSARVTKPDPLPYLCPPQPPVSARISRTSPHISATTSSMGAQTTPGLGRLTVNRALDERIEAFDGRARIDRQFDGALSSTRTARTVPGSAPPYNPPQPPYPMLSSRRNSGRQAPGSAPPLWRDRDGTIGFISNDAVQAAIQEGIRQGLAEAHRNGAPTSPSA